MADYQIDIDLKPAKFSKAFQDFYSNHFENSLGLTRYEVDKYFYKEMTEEELEIAKGLVRKNLGLGYTHLFEASGDLHDENALPVLYEHLKKVKDLSRQLIIGQAIWKINGDPLYQELLRKLQKCRDHYTKEAHFGQVTDLQNLESIDMLITYLNDKVRLVRHLALSELNYLLTGNRSFDNQFPEEYFSARRNDETFKNRLLLTLRGINQ